MKVIFEPFHVEVEIRKIGTIPEYLGINWGCEINLSTEILNDWNANPEIKPYYLEGKPQLYPRQLEVFSKDFSHKPGWYSCGIKFADGYYAEMALNRPILGDFAESLSNVWVPVYSADNFPNIEKQPTDIRIMTEVFPYLHKGDKNNDIFQSKIVKG